MSQNLIFFIFEKKIQFFKKKIWKKFLKQKNFHSLKKDEKMKEKRVKKTFFEKKLKKMCSAELKCQTQLGDSRVNK